MVYDIFTFNGESDLLEIRLAVLSRSVDRFVIVEATETFSGLAKPLYFLEQRERFAKWLPKIRYHVVGDYPEDKGILAMADSSPNVPRGGPEHWRREFYQKESIRKALVNLGDDDLCFLGDVDEIWRPGRYDVQGSLVMKLRQTMYAYHLDNRSSEEWRGTVVTRYANLRDSCLNHVRTRWDWVTPPAPMGWHFTSMGGLEEVRRKLNDSYTSESYNTPWVQAGLEDRMRSNRDYIGRDFVFWTDDSEWPAYLRRNREKYAHLMREGDKS